MRNCRQGKTAKSCEWLYRHGQDWRACQGLKQMSIQQNTKWLTTKFEKGGCGVSFCPFCNNTKIYFTKTKNEKTQVKKTKPNKIENRNLRAKLLPYNKKFHIDDKESGC